MSGNNEEGRKRYRSHSTPCAQVEFISGRRYPQGSFVPWSEGSVDELQGEKEKYDLPSYDISAQETENKINDYLAHNSCEEETVCKIPEPPDGGYGWVVLVASFLCNMIVDGISYTFGIFFTEFLRYYEAPKDKTAWVGSLLSGCYLSSGPLVSALTNRFGCRSVTIAGAIISSGAFFASAFAPSVDVLIVTYGILGGIGFGLIYLPAIVSVGYYFSSRRAFATGISVCGSGAGVFVFAPLTHALLEAYDWRGALIILSGICLNCAVLGALMRPVEISYTSREEHHCPEVVPSEKTRTSSIASAVEEVPITFKTQGHNTKTSNTDITVQPTSLHVEPSGTSQIKDREQKKKYDLKIITDCVQDAGTLEEKDEELASQQDESRPASPTRSDGRTSRNSGHRRESYLTYRRLLSQRRFTSGAIPGLAEHYQQPTSDYAFRNSREKYIDSSRRSSIKGEFSRPLYRSDIFYSGSIDNQYVFLQSKKELLQYFASLHADSVKEVQIKKRIKFLKYLTLPKSMMDPLKEMLDISLLKNKVFMLICLFNVIAMIGYYIPYVYITESSIIKGIPKEKATFFLSVIGIANTLGRIIFGYVSDKKHVNPLHVHNTCIFLAGICILLIPVCYSYESLIVDCTFYGLTVSAYICLTSVILVELLGLEKLTNAFGLLCLFRGTSSMVGPPLAGSIFEGTGSYDYPFYIAGGLFIIAAMLSCLVPFVKSSSEKTKQTKIGGSQRT